MPSDVPDLGMFDLREPEAAAFFPVVAALLELVLFETSKDRWPAVKAFALHVVEAGLQAASGGDSARVQAMLTSLAISSRGRPGDLRKLRESRIPGSIVAEYEAAKLALSAIVPLGPKSRRRRIDSTMADLRMKFSDLAGRRVRDLRDPTTKLEAIRYCATHSPSDGAYAVVGVRNALSPDRVRKLLIGERRKARDAQRQAALALASLGNVGDGRDPRD